MFLVFLPALNFRGNRSPYLWWFHKFLHNFGEQALYVCGEEYFIDPARLFAAGRVEASVELAELYQYQLPDRDKLEKQYQSHIPLTQWQAMEALFPTNPLAVFHHYCTKVDQGFCDEIDVVLDQMAASFEQPEAVITCVNCASLQKVCKDRKLPLVHMELGPLRHPHFLKTAYFDFSGVNGGTEAKERFACDATVSNPSDAWHSVEKLRSMFMTRGTLPVVPQSVERGVSLQIEDDSNVVCFSNGHSALSLINAARQSLSEERLSSPVLVRTHPGSFFALRPLPPGLEVDQSDSSLSFILKCKDIHSINSGMTVEALMLGRKAHVYGESPFGFCINSMDSQCDVIAFSFFVLNYIVPWHLAFTPEYIRWRIQKPAEPMIRQRHLEGIMEEKIRLLEVRILELEKALAEHEKKWSEIKKSLLWRLASPVWKVFRSFSQAFRSHDSK